MIGRGRNEFICGFIPLTDCATLVVAHEFGFAAQEGVSLDLRRETSWSNIRDKMAVGLFDIAHMLAPMPIAMSAGLSTFPAKIAAPFVLSINGNMIGAGRDFAERVAAQGVDMHSQPQEIAAAIRQAAGAAQLRIGAPWAFSMHSLLMDYWLGRCGFDLAADLIETIVPPSHMADALAAGEIDLFCVGEPWGSMAVENGAGRLLASTSAIWSFAPEKVLGVRAALIDEREEAVFALLRALYRAAEWAALPERRGAVAEVLARPEYVDAPAEVIERALLGRFIVGGAGETARIPRALEMFDAAATFPWRSQAQWIGNALASRMTGATLDGAAAAEVWRPDLYRRAIQPLGAPLPSASAKLEGSLATSTEVGAQGGPLTLGPDDFFDGAIFEPILS